MTKTSTKSRNSSHDYDEETLSHTEDDYNADDEILNNDEGHNNETLNKEECDRIE